MAERAAQMNEEYTRESPDALRTSFRNARKKEDKIERYKKKKYYPPKSSIRGRCMIWDYIN